MVFLDPDQEPEAKGTQPIVEALTSLLLVVVILGGCAATSSMAMDTRTPPTGSGQISTEPDQECRKVGDLLVARSSRGDLERAIRKQAARMGASRVRVLSIFQGKVTGRVKAACVALSCPPGRPQVEWQEVEIESGVYNDKQMVQSHPAATSERFERAQLIDGIDQDGALQ